VNGENVQGIIDAEFLFHKATGEVTGGAGDESDNDGAHGADVAGGGGDGGEAGNHAGDDADEAGFARLAPFDDHPGETGDGGGNVGNEHGHARGGVGTALAARVEAEPTDPEHGGADHDHAGIVGRMNGAREVGARADKLSQNKGGNTRGRVNHNATREVLDPGLLHPAATPYPVSDRGVNDDEPKGGEDDHGAEFQTLHE